MQPIRVYRQEVIENLRHFRGALKQHPPSHPEQIYPALIDCRTGLMHFAKTRIKAPVVAKEIAIVAKQTPTQAAQFEIRGDLSEGVDLLVQKIAAETLYVLNLLANAQQILRSASRVRLLNAKERIETTAGWHGAIKRLEAERLLRGDPIGTYLLREGEPPLVWLIEQYPHVEGYVLTVVERENKISDYLILRTGQGWTLHRDDPDLARYRYFASLRELLRHMKKIAVRPL